MKAEDIRAIRQSVEESIRLARFHRHSQQDQDTRVPDCPPILRLEVTNRCNANCVFCAYQYQTRRFQAMDLALFQQAIDQYAKLGGKALNLSPVVGDSLMDKGFFDKVAYLERYPQFTRIELWTNAILLSRDTFENLVDLGVNHFEIAMSGFSAEEYQRIYRNSNYQRVLDNLKAIALSPALEEVHFTIHARTDSLWPTLEQDYLDLRALHDFHIVFEPGVGSWSGAIEQADLPGHMFLIKPPKERSKPCMMLWGGLAVLANGDMTLCGCCDVDGTGLPLGNIANTPLDAHLKNGRMQEVLDSFEQGNPPEICAGCDFYFPHG